MDIKKIGIVGVGGIACGRHILELKTVGDDLDIPQELRFTNYNDLINLTEVDAIEICTPNHLHVPIAAAAIMAGKPVNIEKPLSINLLECEPQRIDSEEIAPVETDDYCSFICEMENGSKGSFVISRCAIGHQSTVKFDIFGTRGILSFDLNNPNVLGVCLDAVDLANENIHIENVPQKFFTTQEAEFIKMLKGDNCDILPTVDDGLRSQRILDSILESSKKRCWVDI